MEIPSLRSDRGDSSPYVVAFDDIVGAHYRVERADRFPNPLEETTELHEELEKLWKKFAMQEGIVLSSFFGECGKTGAALTMRFERRRLLPTYWSRPRLHVALDLATAGAAADLVSHYERLRVKAEQLLNGAEREHVTRMLYDRLCRVIRIVDQMLALDEFRSNPELQRLADAFNGAGSAAFIDPVTAPDGPKSKRAATRRSLATGAAKRIAKALDTAKAEATQAEELCQRAVRRGAMMAYFFGMLVGIVIFSGLGVAVSTLLSNVEIVGFNVESFLTVFIAGAVGAIVSVMSRMSSGDSWLEYETARSYLFLLGMFRPLIGAIFGLALYFGIQSGVLQFIQPPTRPDAVFFFFAFIAFLAGFSERWAGDVIVPIKDHPAEAVASQHASPAERSIGAGADAHIVR